MKNRKLYSSESFGEVTGWIPAGGPHFMLGRFKTDATGRALPDLVGKVWINPETQVQFSALEKADDPFLTEGDSVKVESRAEVLDALFEVARRCDEVLKERFNLEPAVEAMKKEMLGS